MVDVKPSARRTNGAVGRTVNRRGGRRTFGSRAEADEWAADLSEAGARRVWVRDANPDDSTGADGYLVGRRPSRGRVVDVDVDRPGADGASDGDGERVAAAADQSVLGAHEDESRRERSDGR